MCCCLKPRRPDVGNGGFIIRPKELVNGTRGNRVFRVVSVFLWKLNRRTTHQPSLTGASGRLSGWVHSLIPSVHSNAEDQIQSTQLPPFSDRVCGEAAGPKANTARRQTWQRRRRGRDGALDWFIYLFPAQICWCGSRFTALFLTWPQSWFEQNSFPSVRQQTVFCQGKNHFGSNRCFYWRLSTSNPKFHLPGLVDGSFFTSWNLELIRCQLIVLILWQWLFYIRHSCFRGFSEQSRGFTTLANGHWLCGFMN